MSAFEDAFKNYSEQMVGFLQTDKLYRILIAHALTALKFMASSIGSCAVSNTKAPRGSSRSRSCSNTGTPFQFTLRSSLCASSARTESYDRQPSRNPITWPRDENREGN